MSSARFTITSPAVLAVYATAEPRLAPSLIMWLRSLAEWNFKVPESWDEPVKKLAADTSKAPLWIGTGPESHGSLTISVNRGLFDIRMKIVGKCGDDRQDLANQYTERLAPIAHEIVILIDGSVPHEPDYAMASAGEPDGDVPLRERIAASLIDSAAADVRKRLGVTAPGSQAQRPATRRPQAADRREAADTTSKIVRVHMSDLLGDVQRLQEWPEWRWIMANAHFSAVGKRVVPAPVEFIVKIESDFDVPPPPRLRARLDEAREAGADYVLCRL